MPIAGSLTQLAAQGPQNRYLTIDPDMTFWKAEIRRHSMFVTAEVQNDFNGHAVPGRPITSTISRSGDLCHRVYLYFRLNPIEYHTDMENDGFVNNVAYYSNSVGHALIESVSYEIGSHPFDEHTGEALEFFEQTGSQTGRRLGEQIGQADTEAELIEFGKKTQHIYVPFQFDWNKHTERALPLIAMQFHDLKIKLRTRCADKLIVRLGEANNPATLARPGDVCDMQLLVTYVFLDAMERRMFAQQMHEYLMEELQYQSSESRPSNVAAMSYRLNFNHPVTEIFWVVQRDAALMTQEYVSPESPGGHGNDWLNFSGNYDPATDVVYDPIFSASIKLNGHDRTLEHPAIFWRSVHPRERHTSKPLGFFYNYCFALYPEDSQPSGSCNFSRIDNADLRVVYPNAHNSDSEAAAAPFNAQIRIYAKNLNIRRIVSGMAGKLYSN